ncbi:phage tail protein [Stutzerimonas stutzeri]|uniref:phage tail-collar fiber domain-containing protein n=1 Tax=Stutzerimonas stutzeri TaxID=316 RepID=UPI003EE094A1
MTDQNSQFFAILTKVGEAKQANASALGIPWKITHLAVGDANGTDAVPNRLQTALIAERRRAPLNRLHVDPADPSVIVAEQVIPADVGGWWIREIGLYDESGDLVAVANCPPSYKPLLGQGSTRTQVVRMSLIVSSSSIVQLKIDPSVVLATREYVDQKLADTSALQQAIAATLTWKVVPDGYRAKTWDRLMLNNRVATPTLYLPADPRYGQEVQIAPYPFTQYSRFPVTLDGNGHPIMGLDEPMQINEDNVMCACKFLGRLKGWIIERMGYSGNSFTISSYSGQPYGPNTVQKLDARIVRGAPLVMMVHGGGWVAGDRNAANLAGGAYVQQFPEKYGVGFASIDYRLATASEKSYPGAVDDVIAAAVYLKGLGVTDLHILGTSAGANLAALAVIARPDLFTSFIGYYGAYNLTQLAQFSADVQANIGQYTADPAAASPTLQAAAWSTPALLIHGDADTTVAAQQSADFGTAIGVAPISVAGAGHAFTIFGDPAGALPSYGRDVFTFIDGVTEQ